MDCDLCHEQTTQAFLRAGRNLCTTCVQGWDYEASLTPEERQADDKAVQLYLDEQHPL